VSELVGVEFTPCRKSTSLDDGDVVLAIRLRYRVNPDEKVGDKAKKHGNSLVDYDLFEIHYNTFK
jgi:hypothetical protein